MNTSLAALVSGPLYRDPETKTSPSGRTYSRAVVVHRDGDVKSFVRITAFGADAEAMGRLKQGAYIAVVGRAQPRAYLDKESKPAASLELLVDYYVCLAPPATLAESSASREVSAESWPPNDVPF